MFSSSVIPIWLLHSIAMRWMGVHTSSFTAGEALVKKKKDKNIGQTKLMFSLPNLIYGKVGTFFLKCVQRKVAVAYELLCK